MSLLQLQNSKWDAPGQMRDVAESMISGVYLIQTPCVFTGACPWCDDAKHFATASSHLWESGAGYTCSRHSWGVWEIFRYADLWPRSAEHTHQGLECVVVLRDYYYQRVKTKAQRKKYSKRHSFQCIFSICYMSQLLGDPCIYDQEYSACSNCWTLRHGPWCHTDCSIL